MDLFAAPNAPNPHDVAEAVAKWLRHPRASVLTVSL